jgi:hypothetical protein
VVVSRISDEGDRNLNRPPPHQPTLPLLSTLDSDSESNPFPVNEIRRLKARLRPGPEPSGAERNCFQVGPHRARRRVDAGLVEDLPHGAVDSRCFLDMEHEVESRRLTTRRRRSGRG